MGVVYHANYLIWMEIGRTEYCREIGIRYRDMEEQAGIRLAVVDVHCRFVAPARYDDEIAVVTRISEAHKRMVVFGYEMRNERGDRLATGETKHVFLGADLKPMKLPEKYHGYFGI